MTERTPLAGGRWPRFAAALAAAVYLGTAVVLLTVHPPVWPDESLFAAPASSLLREGHLGTPLLEGLVPGIERHTYWMPPVYFLAVAGAFAVGGAGPVAMRALGVLTGLLLLLVTFRLARRLTGAPGAAAAAVVVLAANPTFVAGTLVGRMDALALLWLLLLLDAETAPRPRPWRCGLLGALAVLTHPLGGVGLVASLVLRVRECRTERRARPALEWLAAVIPLLAAWGLYLARDWPGAWAQLGAQLSRKATTWPDRLFASWRMNSGDEGLPLALVGAVTVLGLGGLGLAAARQRRAAPLLGLGLALAAAATVLPEVWYPLYVAPFVAVGSVLLVERAAERSRGWAAAAATLPIALGLIGAIGLGQRVGAELGREGGYRRLCAGVSEELPRGARVMVVAIPDPTLCLARRGDLTLRSFSPVPVDPARYEQVMASMDYLVVSAEPPAAEPVLLARDRGAVQATVHDPRGWAVSVIRLRPRP